MTVELPAGSRVDMTGAWAQVLGEGRLGEVRVKVSSGDVRLDTTGPLQLTASHGSITVERVEGTAEITTSSGSLRVGPVDGPAVLKNSHGTTTVGAATGELRVRGANGDIEIRRAEDSVTATTAHGTLRVGEVACGTVSPTRPRTGRPPSPCARPHGTTRRWPCGSPAAAASASCAPSSTGWTRPASRRTS
ncbi:hypothetical protein APS67_005261 [Streptomyces sp. AVP053U2]|nr:hypothetical protein APS67_005261 [Streptomyces sp. AVP053U2]